MAWRTSWRTIPINLMVWRTDGLENMCPRHPPLFPTTWGVSWRDVVGTSRLGDVCCHSVATVMCCAVLCCVVLCCVVFVCYCVVVCIVVYYYYCVLCCERLCCGVLGCCVRGLCCAVSVLSLCCAVMCCVVFVCCVRTLSSHACRTLSHAVSLCLTPVTRP